MTHSDVIALGASAGGVEALQTVVAGLSPALPVPVLVVLHLPRESPSALPRILDRAGPLPAVAATDGEALEPGHIYVAPADHHLLVLENRVRLSHGPSENGHRPAIDVLFRSVARSAGRGGIAVVLSGTRDDGAVGAAAIHDRGGVVIVQDPEDALYASMPMATLARFTPDHVVPAAKIGALLSGLTAMSLPEKEPEPTGDTQLDGEIAISDFAPITTDQLVAVPAAYGCPSCGGGLFEMQSQPVPRYRCRIGHAWSPESLLAEQAVATEGALWMALRALEEKTALSRRMAESRAGRTFGDHYERMAEESEYAGSLIRELIARLARQPDAAT